MIKVPRELCGAFIMSPKNKKICNYTHNWGGYVKCVFEKILIFFCDFSEAGDECLSTRVLFTRRPAVS